MTGFMGENFLLSTDIACELYHDHAAGQPIYDYHCHLPPAEIAQDRQFENLSQIWLAGDHYKWRAMRAAGVDENHITGAASDHQKFIAWAETVPKTLGNPLYHWTHLELRRPLGITDTLLGPATAQTVWDQCNALLATPQMSARGIITQMNVAMIGTTDDPTDSLEHHAALAADDSFGVEVRPSFRPDKAYQIDQPGFADYIQRLGMAADIDINSYPSLLAALDQRITHFAARGCRASDHGIGVIRFAPVPSDAALTALITRRLAGDTLTAQEVAQFTTAVLVWLGGRYAREGWAMQFHIGALRNTNSRMLGLLGPDTGFDSMDDRPYAADLASLLDAMDRAGGLPKTVLYPNNPKDNEMIATMVGNFQGGSPGKMQFGSGWWHNDQKDGMERQMMQLAQLGLLSQFIGMLTDSRSFLSYTRHEYFRRILCQMLGQWVTSGEAPHDIDLLGGMVRDICFGNAQRYFSIP